jgi:hypothetical protein
MATHPDMKAVAERHDDVVAVWQLRERGWSFGAIRHRTAGLRRLHDGVFVLGHAPATQRQLWRAATLTAPRTYLSHASVGAVMAFRPVTASFEVVTREGNGGPRRIGDLLVLRSRALDGQTTTFRGLPTTTAARALWDLTPHLTDRQLRKAFREAVRQGHTTSVKVAATLRRYPGRRGAARLTTLVDVYLRLPIDRCRSDAEAYGLELLDAAGVPIPRVNERFAGEEADFCWPELLLIIEIDGPQWHQFKDEDARKTAIWRAAGFTVLRIGSEDVFARPDRLLALAPRPA